MSNGLQEISIVNTRAVHQATEFDELIRSRGGIPISYPCIAIEPPNDTTELDDAIRQLIDGYFDWLVLTSANTVWSLVQRLNALDLELPAIPSFKAAAIGSSTRKAVETYLNLKIDLMPDDFIAESLADEVLTQDGRRIFLPTSSIAPPTLAKRLASGNAEVKVVDAYQTVIGRGGEDLPGLLRENRVDFITFTSSSTVTNFAKRLAGEGGTIISLNTLQVACIGPKTSKTAEESGFDVTIEANPHTLEGLLNEIETYLETMGAHVPHDTA